jgi:uncharacterized protein GlcG (DUF336 family)
VRKLATRATGVRWRVAATACAVAIAGGAFLVPSATLPEARAEGPPLSQAEVTELISRTVAYAKKLQKNRPITAAVVDTEGNSLGVFHMDGSEGCRAIALAKAATGSYFSSDFGTFTTRTATFIIQDHFPPGVLFAPGGPLYGVQFSSIATSDVNSIYYPRPQDVTPAVCDGLPEIAQARVRGELGGVAIYKNGKRVGGIGLDDGGNNKITIATNKILNENRKYRITFRKLERGRNLERIAMKAASGFLPDRSKRATRINLDGFRLPYRQPVRLKTIKTPAVQPGVDGDWDPDYPLRDAAGLTSRFEPVTLDPPSSAGKNAQSFDVFRPSAFPVRASTDGNLSEDDVRRILWQGVQRANITRAAIRRPIGLAMQCWVSVVDTNGEVLGVVRTPDATLFSYDVSVQKARTAALFSDRKVAWACRSVGQHAQMFFPAGQQRQSTGPIYQLQDGLTVGLLTGAFGAPAPALIRNGITVFPGGVPIYDKAGNVIGGVGVSGDGVDQDDIVADYASLGFRSAKSIRCDRVPAAARRASMLRVLDRIEALAPVGPLADPVAQEGLEFFQARLADARKRVRRENFAPNPPFVKYPRHPGPVTIRVK